MATMKKAQNSVPSDTLSTKKNYETSPFSQTKQAKEIKDLAYKAWLKGSSVDPKRRERFHEDERVMRDKAMRDKKRAGGFDSFKTPTAKDSADYRAGFDTKIKNKELKQGDKPSGAKIRGYNEAFKRTKKAKSGTSMKTCKGGC